MDCSESSEIQESNCQRTLYKLKTDIQLKIDTVNVYAQLKEYLPKYSNNLEQRHEYNESKVTVILKSEVLFF